MRKSFIALALLVVTFSTFLTSCADQPKKQKALDRILATKTLIVGTTANQFPFTFKDESGKLDGIDIRIANYLANDLGVAVKYEVMDFDKLIPSVENGAVDIVFSGVSITTERNARVAFPGVYYKSGKSILSKSKTLAKGKAEDVNIESVTLVTVHGTTSEEFVKNRFPNAKLLLVENNTLALELLGADKADGLVADFNTCETMAFTYENSFLYYKNISKSTEKEFISPVVAAGDNHFINLVSNYIDRINAFDKSEAIDNLWYQYAKF